ncbi:MAG: PfkB family carbohydrate kinase, partial [Chloroflexota bacterium]
YVRECCEMGIPYLYDPSQQIVRLDAAELERGMRGAMALFVNDYEYALIQKATGLSAADVLKNGPQAFVVVTRGEKGATIYTHAGEIDAPVVPPLAIVDPTGVGDAFRGGYLTGFSRGFDVAVCARMGALAATYCLEQRGPQGQSYTRAEFVARYRLHFDDQGLLDQLLA